MVKHQSQNIVISGANGFLGKHLRHLLQKKDVRLVCISRRNFPTYNSEKKILTSDLKKNFSLSKIKKYDCFIHLIGTGRQTPENDFEHVNVQLTKNAIRLCKLAKIKKFIFISGLGVSKNSTSSYFISKLKAEQEIINSGLDYTIFRASYIIGKDDPLTKSLNNQIKNGTIIIPGSGKYNLQPIYVNDVCKIIFQASISKNFSKQIIDLVGPEIINFISYVKLFRKNKRVTIKKIDLEKMYNVTLHNPKSVYGVDDLNILIGNFVGNYKKLQKLSKIKFVNFRKIL